MFDFKWIEELRTNSHNEYIMHMLMLNNNKIYLSAIFIIL